MSNTKAAALNRAFNNADATVAALATTAADITADQIAAANKFDVATLTDAALAKQVMTNMGFLPSTVAAITQLEIELAAYFGGMGKGNRGFVVLQLSDILSGIAATDATYGAIATAWNAEVAASVTSSTVNSITLTTSKDTATGGSRDDTFVGALSTLTSADTFGATDVISGGAGTADTIKLSLQKLFGGFTTGSMTGVEIVELTNDGAASFEYDGTGSTGVTTYTINGAKAGVTLADVQSGVTTYNVNGMVGKSGSATTFASVLDGQASEVTGLTDAVTLNSNGNGFSSSFPMATSLASIETLNLNVTGSNFISLAAATGVKTLNVTGAGTVNITAVDPALTKFNASAATGAVTANLVAATGTLTQIAMGAGNDLLTLSTADLSGTGTVTGGAGTNELTLTNATAGKVVEYTMSGFQTINIASDNTASFTFSGTNEVDVANIKTVATNAGTTTFVNMGSSAISFTGTGVTSTDGDISSDHTGNTTLTLTAVTTTSTQTPGADYTFGSSTGSLTLNIGGAISTNGTEIVPTKATSLTINSTSKLNAAGTSELTTFNSAITAPEATTVTVNSGGTGYGGILGTTAAITAAKAKTVTVVNGTQNGNLVLNGGAISALTVTSGASLDLATTSTASGFSSAVTASLTGLETLTVTNTSGTVTIPDTVKLGTATLTGSGSTTAGATANSTLVLGALGATTNSYDLSIAATGWKGGVTQTGAINTGTGYDISYTDTAATGAISLASGSTIGGTSVDDITINVAGAASTVRVGTITAAGDVTLNAAGAGATTASSGTLTFTGDKVTVNISGTGDASSANITATAATSATLTGSSLVGTTFTVTGASTSQATTGALAVYVKGGVLTDVLNVTGASTQTSVTVTGDMGATAVGASDTVTITSAGTIDISGLTNYETSVLTGTQAAGTIVGGAGADVIRGRQGADTLTGGAGADSFRFNDAESNVATPDTITDLKTVDEIWYDNGTVAFATTGTGTASGTIATINSFGAVVFTGTAATTLTGAAEAVNLAVGEATAGLMAWFTFGGSTYAYIDSAADSTTSGTTTLANDLVIKLTGVSLPSATVTTTTTATGLEGNGNAA